MIKYISFIERPYISVCPLNILINISDYYQSPSWTPSFNDNGFINEMIQSTLFENLFPNLVDFNEIDAFILPPHTTTTHLQNPQQKQHHQH
jgi:hypothetical protein